MPPYETLCTMYDETLKRILGKHFAAFLKSDLYARMVVDSASSEQDSKQVGGCVCLSFQNTHSFVLWWVGGSVGGWVGGWVSKNTSSCFCVVGGRGLITNDVLVFFLCP